MRVLDVLVHALLLEWCAYARLMQSEVKCTQREQTGWESAREERKRKRKTFETNYNTIFNTH